MAPLLKQAGADLIGIDPSLTIDSTNIDGSLLTVADDPYVATKDAEVTSILTEWPDFCVLDWPRLAAAVRQPIIVDTRNLLDPDVMRPAKLDWIGVGRRAGNRSGQRPTATQ